MSTLAATTDTTRTRDAFRFLGAGVTSGFLADLLIGGVGGRVAMFVLRVTSNDALHGTLTDDGFTIGVVSLETLGLLLLTALAGTFGGVVYLFFRAWIPPRLRLWVSALGFGAAGSVVALRPGGVDFTLLSPIVLAVAMFVALPVAYGLALAWSVERLLRSGAPWRTGVLVASLAPLLLLAALAGLGILLAAAAASAAAIHRRAPELASLWTSPTVTWVGRGFLFLIVERFLAMAVGEAIEILG